jgi:hypothetical protein
MGGDLTLKVFVVSSNQCYRPFWDVCQARAYFPARLCFNQTPGGNDFEESCIEFENDILKPFQDFLRLVYCESS